MQAATGIMIYAQQSHNMVEDKESWHEKLGQWEEALKARSLRTASSTRAAMTASAACPSGDGAIELLGSGAKRPMATPERHRAGCRGQAWHGELGVWEEKLEVIVNRPAGFPLSSRQARANETRMKT